jgi:hypothetical protein
MIIKYHLIRIIRIVENQYPIKAKYPYRVAISFKISAGFMPMW